MTPDRARAYLFIWLGLAALVAAFMAHAFYAQSQAHGGKPVASDFMTFWSAARLAVQAGPEAAYDDAQSIVLQHAVAVAGDGGEHYSFVYPPPYLMLILPLGLGGFVPMLCVFLAAGCALLLACLRRILRVALGVAALMVSPAMLMNTIIGQNGAFTASCFGGAMLLLERAPIRAGVCLGLLVCKPHLAILVPVGLAAAGRWRALVACGTTAAALCALSWVVLGGAAWRQFFTHSAIARTVLENYPPDWAKIQTVFSAVRLLHGSVPLAYSLHACAALAALLLLAGVARRRPGAGLEVAALVPAALIATPYLFDYDLTCLLVPMAYFGAAALRDGWRDFEKPMLLALYVLPMAARALAQNATLPLVPPALFALLLLCRGRGAVRPLR
jgi:hypothetical protein